MSKTITTRMGAAAAAAAACLAFAGCTSTVSKGVNSQGQASQIIFPALSQSAVDKAGIFPNIENLRKIGNGVTKADLYYLAGPPHFRETIGAREWDYIFKFRDSANGSVAVCQYKVIFDKDMKGQSFYWQPAECANFVNGRPAPAPAVVPAKLSLSADALFQFDKSDLKGMRQKGKDELDALAASLLSSGKDARVRLLGHTDRLGSSAYNQRLSQQRAQTVRSYLISKGVPAANISAGGAGASQPLVQCNQRQKQALIACLAPNRRVDVEVS